MTDEEFKAMLQKHGGEYLFSDSIWKRALAVFGYNLFAVLLIYAGFLVIGLLFLLAFSH